MDYLNEIGKKAKQASKELLRLTSGDKNNILTQCAAAVRENTEYILHENEKDMAKAKETGIKESLLDRLMLNDKRLLDIADAMEALAELKDPVGEVLYMKTLPNGLKVGKKRVPLGVIGMIYESRPNVTADVFSLCLKAGSATVLKGGKEALYSNKAFVEIFRKKLSELGYNPDFVQLIEDTSRETTVKFMKLNQYLDLLIPRGGAGLIKTVVENSTVPVIETGTGNCHIYVDESADLENAVDIVINAKVQRPGVCNSCEKVLVHEKIKEKFLPMLNQALSEHGVEIRAHENVIAHLNGAVEACEEDWYTEFLDLIIGIKAVKDTEEAIEHINTYSTHHSEAILTESYTNSQKFLDEVDSAAVYVNASTRFTDGFEFGFGAEIGISTQKLHARGPMGLEEITATKYIIYGNGQIRD